MAAQPGVPAAGRIDRRASSEIADDELVAPMPGLVKLVRSAPATR